MSLYEDLKKNLGEKLMEPGVHPGQNGTPTPAQWKAFMDYEAERLAEYQKLLKSIEVIVKKHNGGWVGRSGAHVELQYPTAKAMKSAEAELEKLGVEIQEGSSNVNVGDDGYDRTHRIWYR